MVVVYVEFECLYAAHARATRTRKKLSHDLTLDELPGEIVSVQDTAHLPPPHPQLPLAVGACHLEQILRGDVGPITILKQLHE